MTSKVTYAYIQESFVQKLVEKQNVPVNLHEPGERNSSRKNVFVFVKPCFQNRVLLSF